MTSSVRKLSKFLIMNTNKENTYSQGRGYISSFFNSLMQEHLKSTPTLFL